MFGSTAAISNPVQISLSSISGDAQKSMNPSVLSSFLFPDQSSAIMPNLQQHRHHLHHHFGSSDDSERSHSTSPVLPLATSALSLPNPLSLLTAGGLLPGTPDMDTDNGSAVISPSYETGKQSFLFPFVSCLTNISP